MPPPPAALEVEAIDDTHGVTIPDPLKAPLRINDVCGRRKKAEKSAWGTAAPSNVERYKSSTLASKPKAKRWDRKSNPRQTAVHYKTPTSQRTHTDRSSQTASAPKPRAAPATRSRTPSSISPRPA